MARAPLLAPTARAANRRPPRRPRHAALLATSGIAFAALLLPAINHPHLRLVWNASASVPLGLYRINPALRPRVGDMVAVRPSPALTRFMAERRYVEAGVLLVKPVAAATGATVCRRGDIVTIRGRAVAQALVRDRLARPLPRWTGCLRLGPDQLFLIAPMTQASFDSRYFGAVHRAQIVGVATPLWTW